MSNYTKENLLSLTPANVPAGTLAMKVGEEIFIAGSTIVSGSATYYKCAEVGTEENQPGVMPEPTFSAPLNAESATAETGQALTYRGTVTF